MTMLAKLVLLAAMLHNMHYGVTHSSSNTSSVIDSRVNVASWDYTSYDGNNSTAHYCYQSANLYLYTDLNLDIAYYIMPNSDVLYSCIIYAGNSAIYITVYTAGTSQGNDNYTVGIDYAHYSHEHYTDYQTTYQTLPISY
jgi:hypothetical protein